MEEMVKVRVAFVVDESWDNEVSAIFDEAWCEGCNASYAHVGQHGPCDKEWAVGCREATPEEYANLLKEMEELVGYTVEIVELKNIHWF